VLLCTFSPGHVAGKTGRAENVLCLYQHGDQRICFLPHQLVLCHEKLDLKADVRSLSGDSIILELLVGLRENTTFV